MVPNPLWLLTLAFVAAGSDMPEGWRRFAPRDAGFSVLMPGTPTEQRQRLETSAGEVTVLSWAVRDQEGRVLYVVSCSTGPSSIKDAEKRLDSARDEAVRRTKGRLESETRIKVGRHPGRDLHIDVGGTELIRTRIYVVDKRLYQVLSIGPRERVRAGDPGRFLASFRLTGDE